MIVEGHGSRRHRAGVGQALLEGAFYDEAAAHHGELNDYCMPRASTTVVRSRHQR
jgi:CO/xanthine dehydrogenase Mo-binding subunit